MPGFCGILTRDSELDGSGELAAMVGCMMHEPTYRSGTLSLKSLGLHLGWTAHERPDPGPIPAWSASREGCVLLAGEGLPAPGSYATSSPAEAVATRLPRLGPAALLPLNGVFSGVFVDIPAEEICLFNDRFGLGRVYLADTPKALYFASEAKAILRVRPELRALSPPHLAQWLAYGCVLQDGTLFPGITLLPPASAWWFRQGRPASRCSYFHPSEWEEQAPLPAEVYYEHLVGFFPALIQRYLEPHAEAALSLTGGVDSRMILAWARVPPGRLRCYSFSGPIRDCFDAVLGQRIARACGQPHEVIRMSDRFFSEFIPLASACAYISDGTMDPTGTTELFVHRRAREIAPIRVTGNYGGEILRTAIALKPRATQSLAFSREVLGLVEPAHEVYRALRTGPDLSFVAFRQLPWHHYSRLSIEQSQLTLRSPYLDTELVRHAYRAPRDHAADKELSLRLIADGNPALGRIITDRGIKFPAAARLNRIRRSWMEFLVKAEYAMDYGMPDRWSPLDRVLAPLRYERLFLGRHKFYHFRTWYRGPLAGQVRDLLLDRRTLERSCIDASRLQRLVEAHLAGRANHTRELHAHIAVELLHRRLLDQPGG